MVSLRLSDLQKVASRCQTCLFLGLALGSGALLPIQASLNAQLARSLDSIPLAADISYLTGTVVLMALLLSGRFDPPNWSALGQAPRWSWIGGVLGAWYITSSTYFVSVLGTTLTLGLVVGGQAIVGVITDHYGWLNLPRHRLTPHRRFALGLMAASLFLLTQPR
ncbi:DMT family transporter [Nodosilinea sp. FACHB-131]|uniref:DMT family transporter n=1 Tax=Cyanophyceae TaxID=3028117 RepID=UPI001681CB34|nr:DMT family transporter [Nodosilinea sp. FACHB-131]MBD1877195.1 DMT family transporter [Nodosilinea sp. FACHB-131]